MASEYEELAGSSSPILWSGHGPFLIALFVLLSCLPAWSNADNVLTATNHSYRTTCAEEDNVNVPLAAHAAAYFSVRATHPLYPITRPGCGADFDPNRCCAEDFSGCQSSAMTFARWRRASLSCNKIFDNGINAFTLCTDSSWWRPFTMTVTVAGAHFTGHRLVLNSKIANDNSWPEVFVLYEDGNVRLKPHPPLGVRDVCLGSSVIVGPAAVDPLRPFVDIASVLIDPDVPCFIIGYAAGGTARACLLVNRDAAVLDVEPAYGIGLPLLTFRSMWVADGNADVDHVESGPTSEPILGPWTSMAGSTWVFQRTVPSLHNTSAPDITINATDVEAVLMPPSWRWFLP